MICLGTLPSENCSIIVSVKNCTPCLDLKNSLNELASGWPEMTVHAIEIDFTEINHKKLLYDFGIDQFPAVIWLQNKEVVQVSLFEALDRPLESADLLPLVEHAFGFMK